MKTVTKQIDVYQFSDLSETAKEKVINEWYEFKTYPFLENDILDEIKCNLDKFEVFSNIDLCYSLSYCQGAGLSFSADFNFNNWLKNYNLKQSVKNVLSDLFLIYVNKNSGHYCYAHKNCISYENNYSTINSHRNIDELMEEIFSDIQEYYLDVCKKAEKYGYSILEYRMNDIEFLEHCEANEYNFDVNGKMINL